MPLRAFISAVLVLALALPCAMPCYALAAVDGQEAADENIVSGAWAEPIGSVSDSDGAASSCDSGSPDFDSAQETVDGGEDTNDEISTSFDSSSSIDAGLDSSDYPSWYSDPAFNSYLGYARDDLAQALDGFYQLAEQRELTDEENEQATLAMFAWYYLGYGSPDDEVSTLGVFSKIPIIGSVLDAKNEDIALSILYSVYGIPDSGDWGDYPNKWNPNSANSYMTTGIMGYLNSLVVHTSNTVSWVKSVYDRLGYLLDVERSPFFGDERTGFKGVLRSLSDSHGFLVEIRDSLNGALYGTDDAGNRQSLWQLLYSSQHGIRAVLESVANTNVYLSELKNAVGSIIDNQSKSYELLSGFANRFDKYYDYMYNVFSNDKSQLHLRLKSIIDNQSKSYELLSGFANRFNKYYDYMNSVFSNTKSTLYLELAKIREAIRDHSVTVDGLEVTADLSPVTQRLDEIARLLSLSGQSSLLDSFVGDFTLPVSSALSARVQAALQNAFPFCIPAVMKQVLGLLDVEPVAAQVDYEIMGATVSLDFSAGGFAAQIALVTSWLCRILFVAMLLACSRNFIFSMPSKGG